MKKAKHLSVEESIREKLFETNEYEYVHESGSPKALDLEEINYLKGFGLKETFTYESGSVVDIHSMCINCQARHILKYKDHPVANGIPFQVKCHGVPGTLPPGSKKFIDKLATEKQIPVERAVKLVMLSIDPVAWCEVMFGFNDGDPDWRLRWYQKNQLRCSSNRIVVREGRRTGKTMVMALKLLYLAFNLKVKRGLDSDGNEVIKGPEIIVVTPFQAQLINYFNEMEKLLKRNVDLCKEISTQHAGSLYVKTPFFRMEFFNGATISGFVTGVEIRQDGSSAGALRGQSGNIIYLDEMDLIQPDVLEKVILPILLTSPHTMFFATSTPIGKAGSFHNLCFNRPDFIETYLPSSVLPQWEDQKKDLEFNDPKDDAFVSEYMAHFIESSMSVYKTELIVAAMSHYTYEQSDISNVNWWQDFAHIGSRSDLIKCIGIDWNKNAGSEFVVVCYDPSSHHWWVAECVNVSPTQFNSVRFKEEVMRLNFKWRPNWIYADEGYGHHIIDDLLWEASRLQGIAKDSFEQQTTMLLERLKKFNFSQKVELTDPVNGTLFTRTGKEFLVENTVRTFESGRISFPANDNTIKLQMQNYIIKRRHPSNGRPVYGMRSDKVGDHRLDALMLALGGLFLENHPLYSPHARMVLSQPVLLTKELLDSRIKKNDPEDEKTAGIGVFKLNIQREKILDNDGPVPKEVGLVQENRNRSDFPSSQMDKKSATILEQLWDRDHKTSTRSKPSHQSSSNFFISKKKRKSSRSSW